MTTLKLLLLAWPLLCFGAYVWHIDRGGSDRSRTYVLLLVAPLVLTAGAAYLYAALT